MRKIFTIILLFQFAGLLAKDKVTGFILLPAPYTNSIHAYLKFDYKGQLRMTNNTLAAINVYLTPTVKDTKGNLVTLMNYKSNAPITLRPGQNDFNVRDIMPKFADLTPDKYIFQHLNQDEVIRNGLPEGTYTITYSIFEFTTFNNIGLISSNTIKLDASTATADCPTSIINAFYNNYRENFNISELLESPGMDINLFGYQKYLTNEGSIGNIELHGDCRSGKLWISFPDNYNHVEVDKWFAYSYSKNGANINFNFLPNSNVSSPAYPPLNNVVMERRKNSFSQSVRRWCHDKSFAGPIPVEIPHWSPVLIYDDHSAFISEIHTAYQKPDNFSSAIDLLTRSQPEREIDLENRAQEGWQSVTLRGIVKEPEVSPIDYSPDHTFACNLPDNNGKNIYASNSPLDFEIFYETFPEFSPPPYHDWECRVFPDYDVRYLLSDVDKTQGMQIEIEQWSIPENLRPELNDYIVAIGRWIVDCGHSPYYTEVHPPELMVSSHYNLENTENQAKIVAPGSWIGDDLKFEIWPVARPNIDSKLVFSATDQKKEKCDITIMMVPVENPNHLECVIHGTVGESLVSIDQHGVVEQACHRGYEGFINCAWTSGETNNASSIAHFNLSNRDSDKLVANNFPAIIRGKINGDEISFKDTYIFFKPAKSKESNWRIKKINSDGTFSINASYQQSFIVKPYNINSIFDQGEKIIIVGRSLNRNTNKSTNIEFTAKSDNRFSSLSQNQPFVPKALSGFLFNSINNNPLTSTLDNRQKSNIERGLTNYLFQVFKTDGDDAELSIYAHLSQLVSDNGVSFKNTPTDAAVFKLNNDTTYSRSIPSYKFIGINTTNANLQNGERNVFALKGQIGKSSSNATVRAALFVGTNNNLRQVGVATGKTDVNGNIKFNISSEGLVHARVIIQVVDNPNNPWFLPSHEIKDFVISSAPDKDQGKKSLSAVFSIKSEEISASDDELTHEMGEINEMINYTNNMSAILTAEKSSGLPRRMKRISPKIGK